MPSGAASGSAAPSGAGAGSGSGLSALDHGMADIIRRTRESQLLLIQRYVDGHGIRCGGLIRDRFVSNAAATSPGAADSKQSSKSLYPALTPPINELVKRVWDIECELAELYPSLPAAGGAGGTTTPATPTGAGHRSTNSNTDLSLFKDSKTGKQLLSATGAGGSSTGGGGGGGGRDIEQMFKEKIKIVATAQLKPNRTAPLFAVTKVIHCTAALLMCSCFCCFDV